MFALGGVGIVLPLENKMKNPESLGGAFGVLSFSMSFVRCYLEMANAISYMQLGIFNYFAEWGSNHEPKASEEDAVSTPPSPTRQIILVVFIAFQKFSDLK